MKTKIVILLLAFAGLAFTASAQTATPKVNAKQKAQKARIVHGVADGSLDKKETAKLAKQQRHIRRAERRAKADGEVTGKERARLARKQRRASKNIAKQKKD